MANNKVRQSEQYVQGMAGHIAFTEKEKYAQKIEDSTIGQLYLGDGERAH